MGVDGTGPAFSGHIDYGKEASQLHSLLVDLLDKVDNKVGCVPFPKFLGFLVIFLRSS